MHKYWGKKPSKDLQVLIEKYSLPGDTVLDPFSGYGVFVCEAYLNNRNAIGNDLNPASIFIQEQLLNSDVDLKLFEKQVRQILNSLNDIENYLYTAECPKCQKSAKIISTLRSKDDSLLKHRIRCSCTSSSFEIDVSERESKDFQKRRICLI